MSGDYKHYGSIGTMVDYNSNAHTVFIAASVTPIPSLRLMSTLLYNVSRAGYDQVLMPDVSDITVNANGEPDLTHQDFTFDEMHRYSDLDYRILRVHLGAEYALSPRVTLTADSEFADLQDNAGGYVFGVESGSILMLRTGVQVNF